MGKGGALGEGEIGFVWVRFGFVFEGFWGVVGINSLLFAKDEFF